MRGDGGLNRSELLGVFIAKAHCIPGHSDGLARVVPGARPVAVGVAARVAEGDAHQHTQTGGAERVLKALKRAGLSTACDETGRQPVGDALRYLGSRLDVMKYAEASAAGLPIGSGNVEAACKSLVTIRMKRPGARWKHVTGNEVLQLRALQLSDRWDEAMPRILRPLRKPIHVISRPEALGHAA